MTVTRVIFGCSGLQLTSEEEAFFKDVKPWGFILFRRNVASREQVASLCNSLRSLTGRSDTPILIDQEGGRVQRMGPPTWNRYPSAEKLSEIYANDPFYGREIVRLTARLIAYDLSEVGISVNCAPVLDIRAPDANSAVIGDRSFSMNSDTVAVLGRAFAEGLLAGGVLPVVKHIPGHGRSRVDSHECLPVVEASLKELEENDFQPFCCLKDMPAAIPAHVVYSECDEKAGTVSKFIIQEIIRKKIGYKGLLITDDLSMKALTGSLKERSAAALAAGCDIALHCNGDMNEMVDVAQTLLPLSGESTQRAQKALERINHTPEPFDKKWVEAQLAKFYAL